MAQFADMVKHWNNGIFYGSATKLAKVMNVSGVTVSRWIRGEVPGEGSFQKLSKILGVTEEELRNSFKSATKTELVPVYNTKFMEVRLPIMGTVSAEKFDFSFRYTTGETIDLILPKTDKKSGVLRVVGDCMLPTAANGDLIVVTEAAADEIHQGALAVIQCNGESTLKRLYRTDGGIELRPDNKKYKTVRVKSGEELHIVGKVLWIVRKP